MGSMTRGLRTGKHSLFVVVRGAGNHFSLLPAFALRRHMLCPGSWRLLRVAVAQEAQLRDMGHGIRINLMLKIMY